MKLERVKYTRYFKETEEWLGAEIQVEEGDNEPEVWQAAIWSVEAAYQKKWGKIVSPSTPEVAPVINTEHASLEERIKFGRESILSCTELKVLESYKLIVKATPQLQEAYDTMYQKLSK